MEEVKSLLNESQLMQQQLNSKLDLLARSAGISTVVAELPDDVSFPMRRRVEVDEIEVKLDDRQLRETLVSVAFNMLLHSFGLYCLVREINPCLYLSLGNLCDCFALIYLTIPYMCYGISLLTRNWIS